jgi:hypothetical protein
MPARHTLFISLLCAIVCVGAAQENGQVHSFRFRDVQLRAALDSLMGWYDVPVIYLDKDVAGKRVTAECSNCTFDQALRAVNDGQGLLWRRIGNQVLLQKREAEPESSAATLSGTISDSLTAEGVLGADVLLFNDQDPAKPYRWCPTNPSGFFSLRNIEGGTYVLHVRRLGYRTLNQQITIVQGLSMVHDVALVEEEILQPEITVEGRRSAFSASEGISRGVYIRATPSDHNQYLLEGARIYNPLHVGGVMSAFNIDALRDVQVVAGGVPPYYGGRIGGILDLALRDGAGKGLSGSASAGSLGASLLLEGPVFDATTLMISGRQGYPDLFLSRDRDDQPRSDLHSSEVIGKLTYHPSRDQRISFIGYFEADAMDKSAGQPGRMNVSNSFHWGNVAANLRWVGVASPSLFFSALAVYTRYGFDMEHLLTEAAAGPPKKFDSDYLIEDATVRAHAEYFYDEYHTMLSGVELMHHRMGGTINAFSSQIASMSFDGYSPWELSVYVQDQWRLVPSVLAELGVRATSFVAKQGSFSGVDPRFSLAASLSESIRLYSSLSSITQFVHPYRNSGVFLFYPSIFLYPSTERIPPSTSLQFSLGMEKNFSENRYRLAIESYYRTTQKLHEFVYDTTAGLTLMDALLTGEENVYGGEITIDKRFGEITGTVRYGYSWASDRFAELNGGAPFRPRFDRRHELYAAISYVPDGSWTFGAVCLLSSNKFPSFAPTGVSAAGAATANDPRLVLDKATNYAEPFDLNGDRLPGFQRLELLVQHRFSGWGASLQATLRMLNGYGLIDPFTWSLRQNSDLRLKWSATINPPPLFPLYPVVSLSVRF